MSIHQKALLVSLSIGTPPQSRKIRGASEEVELSKKTAKKQASVVSRLFAKDDLSEILSIAGEARRVFKEKTLPWGRGVGIIPTNKYFDFLEEMRNLKERFNSERDAILGNFAEVLRNAATVNGDLFDLANYPAYDEMQGTMYMTIDVTPVPDVNEYDKLAGLTEEELNKLKEEAVISVSDRTGAAVKDLFSRLFKTLQHAAERLQPGEDGTQQTFRDSLLLNIERAIEAAETLNINDDAEIVDLTVEARKAIDGITAAELRTNLTLRGETAAKVEELAKKVANFL